VEEFLLWIGLGFARVLQHPHSRTLAINAAP